MCSGRAPNMRSASPRWRRQHASRAQIRQRALRALAGLWPHKPRRHTHTHAQKCVPLAHTVRAPRLLFLVHVSLRFERLQHLLRPCELLPRSQQGPIAQRPCVRHIGRCCECVRDRCCCPRCCIRLHRRGSNWLERHRRRCGRVLLLPPLQLLRRQLLRFERVEGALPRTALDVEPLSPSLRRLVLRASLEVV